MSRLDQMSFNPFDAWKAIDAIRLGLKSHHRKSTNVAFRKDDGSIATTDEENIVLLEAHFTKVFNNRKNVNFDILDKL